MTDDNQPGNIEVEGADEEEYEEYDDQYEEEEYESEEQEYDEDYDSWVSPERHSYHLRPLVIGLLVFAVVAAGAVAFAVSGSDPAAKFDSAPIVNVPEEGSGLSATGVQGEPIEVKAPDARPRQQRKADPEPAIAVAEPAPVVPEPVAEPEIVETAAVVEEPPAEPVAEVVGEPAAQYDEVLAQAKKERKRKVKQELLRQAIELNPNGDEALASLALMLMERGKTREEALDLASRAVEANPDNGLAWLVIGYVKQVVGKAAEARDAYRKCAGCSGPKRYVNECRQLG
jgi:tetratricopeptide (TPR) repeat protein